MSDSDIDPDALAKAARLFERLDHTTDDVATVCEEEDAFAFYDTKQVMQWLDTIGFQCTFCGYWKRQRENATPNEAQWFCQECKHDGDV